MKFFLCLFSLLVNTALLCWEIQNLNYRMVVVYFLALVGQVALFHTVWNIK